jgi:outer membrane protein OmpA-like peptidoglycan-associated protein
MTRILRGFLASFVLVVGLASSMPARADERGPNELRLDVGAGNSFRASDDRDSWGFGGAFEYERRVSRFFGVGGRIAGLLFPYDTGMYAGSGWSTYLGIGPNARLHLTPNSSVGDLWVAGGAQLVITGDLLRAGVDGGLGFDFGIGHGFTVGPFIRYMHIFQPNGVAQGGEDGRILFFGVSFSWAKVGGDEEDPRPSDRDGDTVLDDVDACPDVAASTADGCPAPVEDADADHDGVPVPDDQCPTVVGVAPTGCPAPVAADPSDRDGDGVTDDMDACPDVAASTPDGCPVATSNDRDHDGVLDDADACPDQPARTPNGCPRTADRDGDNVPDSSDGCPDVPGTMPDGCAGEATSFEYHLHFDSESYGLEDETVRQLIVIRDRLRAEPRIEYVVILGHADQRGPEALNQELSLRRARAVLEWLVRHGISRRRLEARGAGSDRAIVQGDTAEELAPNRRVELYIVRPPVDSNP